MFLGSCFTILNMFGKSLKNVKDYFNHIAFWYLFVNSIHLLIICGDVEQNPGPKNKKYLSLCNWNLNSLKALKAFNATKKFDFICLSESYLDSTISSEDSSLSQMIKIWSVLCIYYIETIPPKIIQINSLPDCLVCEINYENKKNLYCYIIAVSKSK